MDLKGTWDRGGLGLRPPPPGSTPRRAPPPGAKQSPPTTYGRDGSGHYIGAGFTTKATNLGTTDPEVKERTPRGIQASAAQRTMHRVLGSLTIYLMTASVADRLAAGLQRESPPPRRASLVTISARDDVLVLTHPNILKYGHCKFSLDELQPVPTSIETFSHAVSLSKLRFNKSADAVLIAGPYFLCSARAQCTYQIRTQRDTHRSCRHNVDRMARLACQPSGWPFIY